MLLNWRFLSSASSPLSAMTFRVSITRSINWRFLGNAISGIKSSSLHIQYPRKLRCNHHDIQPWPKMLYYSIFLESNSAIVTTFGIDMTCYLTVHSRNNIAIIMSFSIWVGPTLLFDLIFLETTAIIRFYKKL